MDGSLYRCFNRLADRTSWAHGVMKFYASNGIVVFGALILLVYVLAWRHDDQRCVAAAVWAGGAALVSLLVGQLVGGPINRARPYETMPSMHVLIERTSDFSFPSDHALVSGAVAVCLLFANRRWGIVACVAAGLMALARVYVGAHYPGDVAAGLLFGAVVAIAGGCLLVPVLSRVVARLVRTPLRPLLSARRPAPALIDARDV